MISFEKSAALPQCGHGPPHWVGVPGGVAEEQEVAVLGEQEDILLTALEEVGVMNV